MPDHQFHLLRVSVWRGMIGLCSNSTYELFFGSSNPGQSMPFIPFLMECRGPSASSSNDARTIAHSRRTPEFPNLAGDHCYEGKYAKATAIESPFLVLYMPGGNGCLLCHPVRPCMLPRAVSQGMLVEMPLRGAAAAKTTFRAKKRTKYFGWQNQAWGTARRSGHPTLLGWEEHRRTHPTRSFGPGTRVHV
eukprot:gene25658-biopygen22502